jgi:capsular polysaccharide transport system permease protein
MPRVARVPPELGSEDSTQRAQSRIQRRRGRLRAILLGLALFTGLPTVFAAVYFGLFATRFYVSESKFVVETNEHPAGPILESVMASPFGGISVNDLLMVKEYIISREAMKRLNEEHGFLDVYRDAGIDWLTRLSADDSLEEAFDFYKDLVQVTADPQAGVGRIEVRAPTAELARRYSAAVLAYSEEVVNRLSERSMDDRLEFAKAEVAKAEERLLFARLSLGDLQRSANEFNPIESVSGVVTIRMEMESELARTRAELDATEAILQPGAHQLVLLRNKVASLERQVELSRARVVSEETNALGESAASFEAAAFEKEFAEQAFESALEFLELTRIDAAQKSRYLAVLVPPSVPDEPIYPDPLLGVAAVFVVSLVSFLIGAIMIAVVREHARV